MARVPKRIKVTPDSELAAVLEEAKAEPLILEKDGEIYRVNHEGTAMATEKITIVVPTQEELARRQEAIARILENAKRRNIAPLTTADSVHQARDEQQKAYERWSR